MIRVSLLSVAAVLAFAAGTVPSAFAKDGVYTSTTLGRNGDVTVQTTITNGRIADVKVLDWSETHPIADLPRVKVPADIRALALMSFRAQRSLRLPLSTA